MKYQTTIIYCKSRFSRFVVQRRPIRNSLLLIVTILSTNACGYNSNVIKISTTEPTTPIKVNSSSTGSKPLAWLKSEPCWEGITPGITSLAEAQLILEESAYFTDVKRFETSGFDPTFAIVWKWASTSLDGEAVAFKTKNNLADDAIIDYLTIHFPAQFSLQDVIVEYGQPTHILPVVDIGDDGILKTYGLEVYFEGKGILLYSRNHIYVKPTLDENLEFAYVGFLPASREDMFRIFKLEANEFSSSFVEWRGFQAFEIYCELRYNDKSICE